MLIAPHFLVGTAIAVYAPELGPAALAAVGSHFVLDAIPHRDIIGDNLINRANSIIRFFDLLITGAVFFTIVPKSDWLYGFVIGVMAISPDILAFPKLFWPSWYQGQISNTLHHWHTKIIQSRNAQINWFWGLLPQIITVAAAIYFIITKPLV